MTPREFAEGIVGTTPSIREAVMMRAEAVGLNTSRAKSLLNLALESGDVTRTRAKGEPVRFACAPPAGDAPPDAPAPPAGGPGPGDDAPDGGGEAGRAVESAVEGPPDPPGGGIDPGAKVEVVERLDPWSL